MTWRRRLGMWIVEWLASAQVLVFRYLIRDTYWRSHNGRVHFVSEMTDEHLINAITMKMSRGEEDDEACRGLLREAAKRGLKELSFASYARLDAAYTMRLYRRRKTAVPAPDINRLTPEQKKRVESLVGIWFQVSAKYRHLARLPEGKTGKQALQDAEPDRDYSQWDEGACGDHFLRCFPHHSTFGVMELNVDEWAYYKKIGGSTYLDFFNKLSRPTLNTGL